MSQPVSELALKSELPPPNKEILAQTPEFLLDEHLPRWLLVLGPATVVSIGAVLRLIGIGYDYPFLLEVDEIREYRVILRMMHAHSLDPHFYAYGPLLAYLEALWLLPWITIRFLLGHPAIPKITLYSFGTAGTSDPAMHIYARLPFVLLGVATIWLAFLVGRQLGGYWCGLLAALFLALSPLHIYQSHLVLPNAPTSFFALLTLWFTFQFTKSASRPQDVADRDSLHTGGVPLKERVARLAGGRSGNLTMAALSAALGTAFKYNAIILLAMPLLAVYLCRSEGDRKWATEWLRLCLVTGIAFLLVTPVAIFNAAAFVHGAGYELKHYAVIGGGGTEGGPSFIWYARYLIENEGLLLFPTAVLGLAIMVWQRRKPNDILLLVTIVLYYLLIATQKVHFDRNLLVILPLIFVAAAYVLVTLVKTFRPWLMALAVALGMLALANLVLNTGNQVDAFVSKPAALVVRSWLQVHLPRGAHLLADGYTIPGLNRTDVRIAYAHYVYRTPTQLRASKIDFLAISSSLPYYGNSSDRNSPDASLRQVYRHDSIAVYRLIKKPKT